MERNIIAIIGVDDDTAFREIDDGPVPYLEQEFGWLEQSGICLKECFIADDDEDDQWQAYLNYLGDWIFSHQGEEFKGMSPASFNEWCNNELVEKTACPLGENVENSHTDRASDRAETRFCPDCGTAMKSTSEKSRWLFCPNCGRGVRQ